MMLGMGKDNRLKSYLSATSRRDPNGFCPGMGQEWLFPSQKSISGWADTETCVCFICPVDGEEEERDKVHQSYLSVFLNCYWYYDLVINEFSINKNFIIVSSLKTKYF